MRSNLGYAFSEIALREQESIMTVYFNLLVARLKDQIRDPTRKGKVDMTQWYNFTTFDVIGDLSFGESFQALEKGEYHKWMSNTFHFIADLRFVYVALHYPVLRQIVQFLLKTIPAVERVKTEHEGFIIKKAEKRLALKTERKDFMHYVGFFFFSPPPSFNPFLSHLPSFRFSIFFRLSSLFPIPTS